MEKKKDLRAYIAQHMARKGESITSFANNSDYGKTTVERVIAGVRQSPRIRRDIALYIGFANWSELEQAYEKGECDVKEPQ